MTGVLRVRVRNAPAAYLEPDSFYLSLVSSALDRHIHIERNPLTKVDLELVSVHPPSWRRAARQLRRLTLRAFHSAEQFTLGRDDRIFIPSDHANRSIWFTGESVRPPQGDWDGFFSFDLDPLGGRNCYVPFWWETLGIFGKPTADFLGRPLSVEELLRPRIPERPRPEGFACAFIGNPTDTRWHVIEALSEIGQVDVYGPAVGRPVKRKLEVASRYRYVVCLENDLYPGYVTEKPFDAWAAGAVPIWWGDDAAGYLNPEALINLASLSGVDELARVVEDLEGNSAEWELLVSQPLLARPPDPSAATTLIRRIFEG